MIDFTKCTNEECIQADCCVHFTEKPVGKIRYFRFSGGEKCEYYWPNLKGIVFQALKDNQNTIPF